MLGFSTQQELNKHQLYTKWVGYFAFCGILCLLYSQLPIGMDNTNRILNFCIIIVPLSSGISYLIYGNIMTILQYVLPRNIAQQHAAEIWLNNKVSILGYIERLDVSVVCEKDKILLSNTNDCQQASAILVNVWDKVFEKELQYRLNS